MSICQNYRDIFEKEIVQKSKGIIFSYSPITDKYQYRSYSHGCSNTAVEELGKLMRHNLFFYAFGEDEIVEYYEKNRFDSLERAAKYAYQQRLPKRANTADGLPSEALLDLLIQIFNPTAYKLAVRTLFRQNDNNEIKGYDLSYFSKEEESITLWLGQAKLGSKSYCASSINNDLLSKYTKEYLARQFFFICDKRIEVTEDAKEILEAIDKINVLMMDQDSRSRAERLIAYFVKNHFKIKIPCLLAYGEGTVYHDESQVYEKIMNEVESIRRYYKKYLYSFEDIIPEIIFCVFPIESIERLRDKEKGFYAGLC